MKKIDIIFAIICGFAVAWIAGDFLPKYNVIIYTVLPLLSILGLWTVEMIGKKFLFLHQTGKFALVGAFADVVDIKVFQLLIIFGPFSLTFKAVSFLAATAIKYWANKHWAFENHQTDGRKKEVALFLLVTLVGLAMNVIVFYYLKKIQVGIAENLWVELCIIFAALATAVWNFLGYKFLVFKK
jgi:putative flippase GtrA